MNISGLSAAQLKDVQRAYARKIDGGVGEGERAMAPDDHHVMETGYSGGGCGESSYTWITAERDGKRYYCHNAQPAWSFDHPAIQGNGRVGYVHRESPKGHHICRVPLWNNALTRPWPMVRIDGSVSALALRSDEKALLFAEGNTIRSWDLAPGLGVRFTRLFHPQAGMQTLATMKDPVEDLAPLPGGGLLVFPKRDAYTSAPTGWRRSCYVVRPGEPGAIEVPLKALSPDGFAERVTDKLPFLGQDDVERFADQAPFLVDDLGKVKRCDWRVLPHPRTVAIAVPEDGDTTGLYKWDGKTVSRLATLPGSDLSGRGHSVSWSDDGRHVLVRQGSFGQGPLRTAVVEAATGRTGCIPDTWDVDGLRATKDGSRMAIVRTDNQVWVYEDATATASGLGALEPPVDRDCTPTLRWSPDGQQAVVWYQPQGADHLALNVFGIDGSRCILPQVDHVKLQGDALEITMGTETRVLSLPLDVAAMEQAEWFQTYCEAAVLGGLPAPTIHRGVEQGEDSLTIGGIRIPVRQEDAPELPSPPARTDPYAVAIIATPGGRP